MYASDYFYASANCENKMMFELTDTFDFAETSTKDIRACNDTNWLYNLKVDEWQLPQVSVFRISALLLLSDGFIYGGDVNYIQRAVRPVLYLTSSAKITGGSGTSADPYTFGL